MPGAQQWTRVGIMVTSRPLVDENNRPLDNIGGGQVGLIVSNAGGPTYHWMDEFLFAAWRAEARRQINAAAARRDPVAMQAAGAAIMKAYNALGLPWCIDPSARNLHRIFTAGSPRAIAGSARAADFGAAQRYNDSLWISHDSGRCIVAPGVINGSLYAGCNGDSANGEPSTTQTTPGPYTGRIPAAARGMFNTLAPDAGAAAGDPTQFLPRMQFITRVPDDQPSMIPPWYRASASGPKIPFPFDPESIRSLSLVNDFVWTTESKQYYKYPDGSDASGDSDGWDVWAFDLNGIGTQRQQVRPAWSAYLIYMQSWVDALESRTARQIVQDSRAYALWRNSMSQEVAGSFAALAGGAVQSVASLQVPDAQLTSGIRTAGAVAAATAAAVGVAIGAAVTAATAATGIGALIGGAITALSFVASTIAAPSFDNYNIDDLERPKPWIERSWLSGDPSAAGYEAGAPLIEIDAPPGFVRPPSFTASETGSSGSRLRDAFIRQTVSPAPGTVRPDGTVVLPPSPPIIPMAVWWTLGGLAFGTVLAYAGSQLTQGRGSRSRSRKSRRSR